MYDDYGHITYIDIAMDETEIKAKFGDIK